jgi:hypothetical protein
MGWTTPLAGTRLGSDAKGQTSPVPVEFDDQERYLRLGDVNDILVSVGEGVHFSDGYDFVDFLVSVSGDGLAARSVVRSVEGASPQSLRAFFRELAADWKGTQGDRTWESIEHDLTIKASRDPLGHVILGFTLRESFLADAWQVRVIVCLEAGEEMAHAAVGMERVLGAE